VGAHYVIADARSYACSGHWNGGACSNHIRVRRDAIERILLGPIRSELLVPERRERMAKEMQAAYVERLKEIAQRAESVPQEAAELDARIARLRERLKKGDPDLTPDELQPAIERAETKRRELDHARSTVGNSAQILSVLPKAAAYYGQQISLGLDGDPGAAAKARPIVRELLGGKVDLVPGEDGSLWAEYGLHMAALLQGAGTCGRGDRI
jgi:site-specific DNA recombinase